jgi:hypothetical protein
VRYCVVYSTLLLNAGACALCDAVLSSSLHRVCIVSAAFHGSCSTNMYSIVQNGLQNLSGTRRMTSGAIFGDGIYLANDLRVAKSFAQGANASVSDSAPALVTVCQPRLTCPHPLRRREMPLPCCVGMCCALSSIGDHVGLLRAAQSTAGRCREGYVTLRVPRHCAMCDSVRGRCE